MGSRKIGGARRKILRACLITIVLGAFAGCGDPMATLVTYKLTIQNDGHGTTSPSGVQTVNNDVPFSISAAPAADYRFLEWTLVGGNGVSIADPGAVSTSVTLTSGDAVVQANFEYMGIRIISPNGGEFLLPDDTYTLAWWAPAYTGNVKIELLKDGDFNLEISPSTPNDGSFNWTVPSDQISGSDYKIKITTLAPSPVWWDDSDVNFTIGKIKVTYPDAAGVVLAAGSSPNITWTSNSGGDVKIELLKGGVLNRTIADSTDNDGSFIWPNVDCPGGTDYRVRIQIISTGSIDESDADFGVLDGITLTEPDGDEVWPQGGSADIAWTSSGAGNVRIDLLKGGAPSQTIMASTPNDGTYSWAIPGGLTLDDDYRIRISSVEIPSVSDESAGNFTIEKIAVTAPNGGECLAPGGSVNIAWTSGRSGTVKIELLKGGVFSAAIIDSTENDGAYSWIVPDEQALGGDYRIRVTRLANTQIGDESDGSFIIEEIAVTSPDGGEVWAPGSLHNVTWTSSGAGSVRIELYKGAVASSTITAGAANNGAYSWVIPGGQGLGADYRVRVTHLSNTQVWDQSNGDFTIEGITVTSPNGGEALAQGGSATITWTSTGVGSARIDLYKGGVWSINITNSTANDGAYAWNIPVDQTLAGDYRIRVTPLSNPALYDESDADFIIEKIAVTSPNGTEVWATNSAYALSWSSSRAGRVRIDLYRGGVFSSTISADTENDGAYGWTIPGGQTLAADYRIRVTHLSNSQIWGQSNGNFVIEGITVTAPNGDETLAQGGSADITWTSTGSGNVKIELYKGGAFLDTISAGTPNSGAYDWTIPGTLTPAGDYRIKITSLENPALFDESNLNFTIEKITVTSPDGGEVWAAGSGCSITWTSSRAGRVKIDLYRGGVFSSTISADTENDGAYSWTVPGGQTLAGDYRIRVTHLFNAQAWDESNADFTMEGITVTAPNGGEVLARSGTLNITWTSSGMGSVKIDLYKGGVFAAGIEASTANDGAHPWNIPGELALAGDYSIRIASVENTAIFDQSNGSFTIERITVASPDGGEVFGRRRTYEISWESSGAGYVKIELYKDEVFDSTISPSAANTGAYSWKVPAMQAPGILDYRVRITQLGNAAILDESNGVFSIQQITETLSNTPASLTEDDTINITVGGAQIVSYRYKLDSGSWSGERDVGTTIFVTGLDAGSHSLSVMGKDGQGVWPEEADAVTFSWQIDIAPPTAAVTNVRNNGLVTSGFIIGTASDDLLVAKVEVQLDGGAYQTAAGTTAWKLQLPTGSSAWKDNSLHTVRVKATDVFGHDWETTAISVRKGANKDVNGDGYADAVVGAEVFDGQRGRVYVLHSSGSSGISIQNASSASRIITGEASSSFGCSVALGDVNGDGYADALVGAQGYDGNQGRAYVFHSGGSGGIAAGAAASADSTITGEAGAGWFGCSVALGDVNGDGYADALVGAEGYNASQGRAYVFHSSGSGGIAAGAAASASATIAGEEGSGWFGCSVALGDVNGDGYADAAVGAAEYNGGQGRAYVFHSDGAGGITITAAASASSLITGEEGRFGCSIALGDVNGDGYPDAAVGADGYNGDQGRAYVFHSGGAGGIAITEAASASSTITGEGGRFGCSIALGDVNGGGYADAVVGAAEYNASQGRAYVFHSSGSGGISITSAASATRTITGEAAGGSGFGGAVALADVNGNGYADAIVGAQAYNGDLGRTYVFHSNGSGGITITAAASASRIINGETGSGFGGAVALGALRENGS